MTPVHSTLTTPVVPRKGLLCNLNYNTAILLCATFSCCVVFLLLPVQALLHIPPSLNPSYSPIQLNSFPRTFKPTFKAFVTFLWIRDATWGYTESTVPDHLITRTLFCPNLLLVLVHHSLSLSVRSKATLFLYQVYQSNSPSKPEQVSSGQNEG